MFKSKPYCTWITLFQRLTLSRNYSKLRLHGKKNQEEKACLTIQIKVSSYWDQYSIKDSLSCMFAEWQNVKSPEASMKPDQQVNDLRLDLDSLTKIIYPS